MYSLPFQDSILQFIVQKPEGKSYIEYIDEKLFDLPENQIMSDLLQAYHKEYRCLPKSETNLNEFFLRQNKKNKAAISEDIVMRISKTIRKLYVPYSDDEPIVKASIIEYKQYRETVEHFKEFAPKIEDGVDAMKDFHKKLGRTIALSEELLDQERQRGGLLLKYFDPNESVKLTEGTPIFLRGVNRMTAAKGFYSPQLVIFMGAPKSFKTGLLLKTAAELVRDGLNVYYVDCENGNSSIRNRIKQAYAECTREDLRKDDEKELLGQIINKVKFMGGEFVHDFYPAHQCCVEDVERNLDYWYETEGFVPDVICWDYPDLMLANDKTKRAEKRFNIQHTYFDMINMQSKRGIFGLGLSQVSKGAVSKAVINMKDFAEDFGKAMNCHAAFAICRTEEEMATGIARIVPVVQREGVAQGKAECFIEIDEARMSIRETDHETAALIAQRAKRNTNADIFGAAKNDDRNTFELPEMKPDNEFFRTTSKFEEAIANSVEEPTVRKLIKLEGEFKDEVPKKPEIKKEDEGDGLDNI